MSAVLLWTAEQDQLEADATDATSFAARACIILVMVRGCLGWRPSHVEEIVGGR